MPTTTPIRTAQHLTLGQLTASGAFAGYPPLPPPPPGPFQISHLPSFLACRNRPSPSSSSPSSRPVQRRPLDSADLRARCACLGYNPKLEVVCSTGLMSSLAHPIKVMAMIFKAWPSYFSASPLITLRLPTSHTTRTPKAAIPA